MSDKPCARGCCWTPYGVCAQHRNCACHNGTADRTGISAELWADVIELDRKRRLEKQREAKR